MGVQRPASSLLHWKLFLGHEGKAIWLFQPRNNAWLTYLLCCFQGLQLGCFYLRVNSPERTVECNRASFGNWKDLPTGQRETGMETSCAVLSSLVLFVFLWFLQLGDLERAQCYFKRVEAKATGHPKTLGNIVMNKWVPREDTRAQSSQRDRENARSRKRMITQTRSWERTVTQTRSRKRTIARTRL